MAIWFQVLILISAGFILFLIELFTPGFGLCGISGLALIIWGCTLSIARIDPFVGIFIFAASIYLVTLFFRIFKKSKLWKKMQLNLSEEKSKGFSVDLNFESLLNKQGKTLSPLRPTGIILIEGKRLEAATDGVFVENNKDIVVIRIEGNKIIVREKSNEDILDIKCRGFV